MKTFLGTSAFALSAVLMAGPASAAENTVSGTYGDLSWTATSYLVAATRTQGGIGETPYTGSMPAYSGTVGLLMGGNVCSGTLLADRRSILTAGHCVAGTNGVQDVADNAVTVFFRDPGSGPDVQFYYGGPGYTTVQSEDIFVHQQYTGDVIDQNDIAVVRLSQAAPLFAQSHELYTNEIAGQVANVTGYGSTSIAGGAVGVDTTNPNRLGWFRQGLNEYDFRLGDERFVNNSTGVNAWASILGEPASQIEYSYWSDFDNGLATQDASCRITQASNFNGEPGLAFCDLGTGPREVGVAGGDSGGGSFIDGRVASVNSYGITFGPTWGDANPGLNSSWGEFTGYVPVSIHTRFIESSMGVPEPATWAMMIAGFGFVGASMRRAKAKTVAFAA